MQKVYWIAVLFLLVLVSCKTIDEDKKDKAIDPQMNKPATEDIKDDFTMIPTSLWSPLQRRVRAEYYYLIGEYMTLNGEDKGALSLMEAAYSLEPNPFVGGKMIATKARLGMMDQTMVDAHKMVLLYPRSASLRLIYGELLTTSPAMAPEAVRQLEKAVQLDPTQETAYIQLIGLYQSSGDSAKAIATAKELVRNLPRSVIGWSLLSRLYLMSNQKKEALVPARRAYDLQSQNPELTIIYAIALEYNGKAKSAIHLYEQLFRLNPTNEQLISRLVKLYQEIGDLEEAKSLLDELVKLPGGSKPGVRLLKAIILWEQKQFAEASEILSQLNHEYPDNDRILFWSALGQEKLNHYDKAIELYKSIPESSQFKMDADFRIAVVYKEQKKYADALSIAEDLLKQNDKEWDIYMLVSGIYADQDSYDKAVEVLEQGEDKISDKSKILFLKGVYQEHAGHRDQCLETMKQVIKLDPQNASALNYMGYLYAEKGEKLDEAQRLIERALVVRPDDGYFLDSLAWVFFQKKDYKKARELLEKSLKLLPDEGVVLEHMADLYKVLKDKKNAKEYYERALKSKAEKRDKDRIEQKYKLFMKDGQ